MWTWPLPLQQQPLGFDSSEMLDLEGAWNSTHSGCSDEICIPGFCRWVNYFVLYLFVLSLCVLGCPGWFFSKTFFLKTKSPGRDCSHHLKGQELASMKILPLAHESPAYFSLCSWWTAFKILPWLSEETLELWTLREVLKTVRITEDRMHFHHRISMNLSWPGPQCNWLKQKASR